jgi:POT family proton-dependent oligopeptide transporter
VCHRHGLARLLPERHTHLLGAGQHRYDHRARDLQSVEPLGVIVFSAIVVAVWGRLRARGAEPSTPSTMLLGIVLVAVAFGLMVAAGLAGGDTGRVAAWWLVAAYLIVAIGEICMSPMGLSLVNRVAPPRSRGLMMGAWFVSLSAGGYLSGSIGSYWDRMPHSRFFLLVVGILAVAALLLAAVLHRVEQVEAAHSAP